MAAAVEAIDYYADAESSFPEGSGGEEITTEYEGIVIVDIRYGKGFNKLSDTMDKIDPYLIVRIPGCEDQFQTEKKENDGKPIYNQRFTFRLPVGCEADHVNLKLMDDDTMGSDDHKASGKIPFPEPMYTFSGRVALDEDKANEDANPIVDVSIMYVPFQELFKTPNVLEELESRIAAYAEDDAADEAEKARLQAALEAMEQDDAVDEAQKEMLAAKIANMEAAQEEAAQEAEELREKLAAAEADDEEDEAAKAALAAELEALEAEKTAAQEAAAQALADKQAAYDEEKAALMEQLEAQASAAEEAKQAAEDAESAGDDIESVVAALKASNDSLQELVNQGRDAQKDLGDKLNQAQGRILQLEADLEKKNPQSETNQAREKEEKCKIKINIKLGGGKKKKKKKNKD